jgi:hypothetical protein
MTPGRTAMSLLVLAAVLVALWATAASIYPKCCG